MKVRIEFSASVDENDRRVITYFYNGEVSDSEPAPADRETVKKFFREHGIGGGIAILMDEAENLRIRRRERRKQREDRGREQVERTGGQT